MIRLFTSYYRDEKESRNSELVESLRLNLSCGFLDEVCLILEGVDIPPLAHKRLSARASDARPTYSDFFRWIREVGVASADVTVVANSDIYFHEGLLALAQALRPGRCAALTRWDLSTSRGPALFDRNDSQDVWVFKGPLRRIAGDFPVGVPRCDNRILFELRSAGYEVINPAFSVRAYHLHSGVREEYQQENLEHFVDPPYAYLAPHNLWSWPRTLLHNFRHPDSHVFWRFDCRKLAGKSLVRALARILPPVRRWAE